jgi:hypothetical protein
MLVCRIRYVKVEVSLRRADYSFKGVLIRACLSNFVLSINLKSRYPRPDLGCSAGEKLLGIVRINVTLRLPRSTIVTVEKQ